MNKAKLTYSIFAILFGAFLFVYGGYDDSPGAQLLGLLMAISGVVGVIKSRKKASKSANAVSKTFTCRELGGTCDMKFSGGSFMEILQQAMPHMMSDSMHKASIMSMEERTGENKDQWMMRMQREFDAKPNDK